MLLLALGVGLARDGCEGGEQDAVAELRFRGVGVDGEDVGAEDEEDWFP